MERRQQLQQELAALRAERDALRAERDALGHELDALRAQLASRLTHFEHTEHLLHGLTSAAPLVIYIKDLVGRFLVSNPLHAQLLGKQPCEVLGAREHDLLAPEEADEIAAVTADVLASREPSAQEFCIEVVDGKRWFLEQIFPLMRADGAPFAIAGVATDITRRREAEDALSALQRQVIESQAHTLVELSAPLMQLAPGVITIPLIGSYDRERSEHMLEVLGAGVVERRARHVLLDFTGLRDVDVVTAATIARATQLVRMLGAQLVLTGITPEIAMMIVHAELDLSEVHVEPTMGDGLARVLRGVLAAAP